MSKPETRPEWEQKISEVVNEFSGQIAENFHKGLMATLPLLPDKEKPEFLGKQLNWFLTGMLNTTAHLFCTYMNDSEDLAKVVADAITARFKENRESNTPATLGPKEPKLVLAKPSAAEIAKLGKKV
jgi:hypothetical protein